MSSRINKSLTLRQNLRFDFAKVQFNRLKKLARNCGYLLIFSIFNLTDALAVDKSNQMQLEVIDPFIEIHTGPAKGYPVFFTVEQGETITIITRRTGWYELKTESGRIGWAQASQIARTLLPTGVPVDLPTVSYGDYLKNSWRVGFKVGGLSGDNLSNADAFSYSIGYHALSWMGVEVERMNFYATEVKGNYDSINALFEPFSQWAISPVVSIGYGRMELQSQPELTNLEIDKKYFRRIGLSGNYYIGRNFLINLGYQSYQATSQSNNERLDQWQLGFNAFF